MREGGGAQQTWTDAPHILEALEGMRGEVTPIIVSTITSKHLLSSNCAHRHRDT